MANEIRAEVGVQFYANLDLYLFLEICTVILYTFKFQSNFKSGFKSDTDLLISFHRFFQGQIFASHTVAKKIIQSKIVKRYNM